MAMASLAQWRGRLEKRVWQRVVRKGLVLKELNECAPVMARTLALVEQLQVGRIALSDCFHLRFIPICTIYHGKKYSCFVKK
jgi:hypothetical protein